MLGSFSEAEDVVQDGWIRWAGVEESIDTPAAYLTRIVTRLSLDRLKSARVRRETYVGPWLPEPLVGSTNPVETFDDDVTGSLMLAMERLSPLERAAFLLHDIFDVPLNEIAVALDCEPAAVRQLASRARRNVKAERDRYSIDTAEADRPSRAFFEAVHTGDTATLIGLLARDVEILADGGGEGVGVPQHRARLGQRPATVQPCIRQGHAASRLPADGRHRRSARLHQLQRGQA